MDLLVLGNYVLRRNGALTQPSAGS
jgi:hypothetical protein